MKPTINAHVPQVGSWHCATRPQPRPSTEDRQRRLDLRPMAGQEAAQDDRQPVEGLDERD